jgi:cytochrome b6-f complex iron-sulfur subunit
MSALLFAVGLAGAQRFYAPQPMAPAQYAQQGGIYSTYASAQAFEAQPVYVSAPMPVAETSGSSFLSGAAFLCGLAVSSAALALFAQKKNSTTASDMTPDVESWDVNKPFAPLTTVGDFMDEPDMEKKIAMLAAAGEFVPDMQRRTIMNLVLLGGAAVPVAWLGGGFVYFFVPPSGGGAGAGLVAKDALGDDVTEKGWQATHPAGERALVQGLKGDAHYLIVEKDGSGIRNYALNAVCTHLGCVVPWNRAANKFMCPCHGSQYDETGKVVRGPAPLSLALAHLDVNEGGKVVLSPWTETDFRTNTPPWWKP